MSRNSAPHANHPHSRGDHPRSRVEPLGDPDPGSRVEPRLDGSRRAANAMGETDRTLAVLCERFEQTRDPAVQGHLAVEALDQVERQLTLARDKRQQLDSIEGALWVRRNGIERFLIETRGREWWRARRDRVQRETLRAEAG